MISSLKISFMVITLLISFGVPIAFAIILIKKSKAVLKSILIGALVFFVFQIVLRIPMLQALSKQSWYISFSKNYILYSIFLGLTAGLFEEVGRYVGFRLFLKDRLNFLNGVSFGVGHGGVESILLVGMAYINNIIYSVMINHGIFEKSFGKALPANVLSSIKNTLISTPDYAFLLAGFERVFTILIQIALSLIVLQAVRKKKIGYLFLAILIHTIVDTPVAYMTLKGVNMFLIELIVMVFAILALTYIVRSKDSDKIQDMAN